MKTDQQIAEQHRRQGRAEGDGPVLEIRAAEQGHRGDGGEVGGMRQQSRSRGRQYDGGQHIQAGFHHHFAPAVVDIRFNAHPSPHGRESGAAGGRFQLGASWRTGRRPRAKFRHEAPARTFRISWRDPWAVTGERERAKYGTDHQPSHSTRSDRVKRVAGRYPG